MTSIYDVEQLPLKEKVDYLREFIDTPTVPEGRFTLYEEIESLLMEYDSLLREPRRRQKLERQLNLQVTRALFAEKGLSEDEPDPTTEEFADEYQTADRESIIPLDSVLHSSLESKVENIERYIDRYPEDARFYKVLLERVENNWAAEAELANAVARLLHTLKRLSAADGRRFASSTFLEEARDFYTEEALPRDSMRVILVNLGGNGNRISSFLRTSKWIYETAGEPKVLEQLKEAVLADTINNKKLIDSTYVESEDFVDWYQSNYYVKSCKISHHICCVNAFYYGDYNYLLKTRIRIGVATARRIVSLVDAANTEDATFLALIRALIKKTDGLSRKTFGDMYKAYCRSLIYYRGNCVYFLSLLEESEARGYFLLVNEQFLLTTKHDLFRDLLASGVEVYGAERFLPLLVINEKSIPKAAALEYVKAIFPAQTWKKYVRENRPFLEDLSRQLARSKEKIHGVTRAQVHALLDVLN